MATSAYKTESPIVPPMKVDVDAILRNGTRDDESSQAEQEVESATDEADLLGRAVD